MIDDSLFLPRPIFYLLDKDGNPYPTYDDIAVAALLSDVEKRRVGQTEKEIAGHTIWLSTVFLVVEHMDWLCDPPRPALFETMLFIDGNIIDGATERYVTRQEALNGHKYKSEIIELAVNEMGKQTIVSGVLSKIIDNLAKGDTQDEQ